MIFAAVVFYALTAFGLFRLRRKRPDLPRPVRAPGYPVLPALYVVLTGLIAVDLGRLARLMSDRQRPVQLIISGKAHPRDEGGKRMLQEPTELLDGVVETLREMARLFTLLVITKGDLFDQESKLARSGLAELFSAVEILSDKNVDSYRKVLSRRGVAPADFVMVGNSLRSDVVPVVEMGGRAVHIPYHLTWDHEQVEEDSLPGKGWYRLTSIRELGPLLASLDRASPYAD